MGHVALLHGHIEHASHGRVVVADGGGFGGSVHQLGTPEIEVPQEGLVDAGHVVLAKEGQEVAFQRGDVVGVDDFALLGLQLTLHALDGDARHVGKASADRGQGIALSEAGIEHDVLGQLLGVIESHLLGGGAHPLALHLVAHLPCRTAVASEQHGHATE